MIKALQASKIRELGSALVDAGFVSLDDQAGALGLCRSTTWTILRSEHKHSGLSVSVINKMLDGQHLPITVRAKLLEYIREKMSGQFGHNKEQLRRFSGRLIPLALGVSSTCGNVSGVSARKF